MIFPRSKAHPAEVCTAYFASHMVTSLIFLNRSLAFLVRTHLRVGHDPGQVFAFARIFQLPLLPHVAVGRPVLFLSALEAKTISALTIDDVFCVVFGYALGRVVTLLGVRTPLYVLVVVSEGLAVPSQVPIQHFAVSITLRIEQIIKH